MKLRNLLMLGILITSLSSCSEFNEGTKPSKNPIDTTIPSVSVPSTNPSTGTESTSKPSSSVPSVSITESKPNVDEMVINLIEFNDLHGHIEQDNGMYGLSNASYLVDKIRNEDNYDNTVLISNGDMFQETAIARLSYGRVVIECMNEMGFDMFALGNHEFDWTLDKCLEYWDNDQSNGEAEFPLLNANLFNSKNELIVDSNRNILPSTIIEREGIKIGLIGLIGNVYNSILASMTKGYVFKSSDSQIEAIVKNEGKKLKDNGADIIVVSIHDAEASSPLNYKVNQLLAKLQYNNEYLIDVVINGHTHTEQKGLISRSNGVSMPVIQSRLFDSNTGNLNAFGRIDLTIDMKTKKVKSTKASHVNVSDAKSNYDRGVQDIVDNYYEASSDVLDEVYCNNEKPFKRQKQAGEWVCNLGMAKSGSDACIINTGGLRGEVPAGMISFKEIYNFNPFDNKLIKMTIKGYDLKRFIDRNGSHYFYTTDTGYIDESKTYTLAIIDYVFYSKYFNSYRPSVYEETNIILRDLMIEELRYYKGKSFNIYNDYKNIHI